MKSWLVIVGLHYVNSFIAHSNKRFQKKVTTGLIINPKERNSLHYWKCYFISGRYKDESKAQS